MINNSMVEIQRLFHLLLQSCWMPHCKFREPARSCDFTQGDATRTRSCSTPCSNRYIIIYRMMFSSVAYSNWCSICVAFSRFFQVCWFLDKQWSGENNYRTGLYHIKNTHMYIYIYTYVVFATYIYIYKLCILYDIHMQHMSSMCSHVSFLAMLAGCPSNLPGACGLWAGPIPMPPSAEATTRDRVDSLFLLCCLLLLKCIYIYTCICLT